MKISLLVITVACFFTFQSKGQYASVWAGYPTSYELSSGFATENTTGHFWLGYLSNVQNINTTWHSNKNFCIMGSGNSGFYASYQVFESNGCSGQLTQVLNGNGVSAIETSGPNNLSYALAGVYNKACYFSTLDNSGNVLSAVSFPFPNLPLFQLQAPSQPVIVESANSGEYYITGSYNSDIYVINVTASGNVLWSSFYSIEEGAVPKDIIMNPYKENEVIIVGETRVSLFDKQGFYLSIDCASKRINNAKIYGNPGRMDGFQTIIASAYIDQSNKEGFMIGGYAPDGLFSVTAWALKVDRAGNIIWSNLLKPSVGSNTGVIDIKERLNTLGEYEYYALLNSSAGMQVLKLNDRGLPFPYSAPNALFNEFVYDLPALSSSRAKSLSLENDPALVSNIGFQVYGTATNFPGFSSSYIVNAYFNGETNCYRTLTRIYDTQEATKYTNELSIKPFSSLAACNNFRIIAYFPGGSVNYPCSGQMLSGSNQRTLPSGISPETNTNENFSIFPNPVINKTVVNYSAPDNSEVSISLYNLVGQHIKTIHPQARMAGTYQEELDFASLNIESGVYFITTTVDGTIHKEKVVYTK